MCERQARLARVVRLHQPNRQDPLIVVLLDELVGLTKYVTDKALKDRSPSGRPAGLAPVTIPVQPSGPTASHDDYRWTSPQDSTESAGHPVVPESLLRKLRGDQ